VIELRALWSDLLGQPIPSRMPEDAIQRPEMFLLPEVRCRCAVCGKWLKGAQPILRWPAVAAPHFDCCSFRCALLIFERRQAA
jgi:hypothetical protein